MNFKKILILPILITVLFNLTGCYDAKGIEELAYAVAIGLDVSDDNQLELTLQFATSGSGGSSGESSGSSSQSKETNITTIKCSSINSGISLINNHVSKRVNLSHCQVIIMSEKIAYSGVSEYLHTLINNVEIRSDASIIISKCPAKEFLKNVQPALETLTARYYESSINSAEYTGYTVKMTLSEFYSRMKDTTSQAYSILGAVNSDENENKPLKVNADYTAGNNPISDADVIGDLGIAVFHGDKLVGELTGLESLCHVMVNNELDECVLSIPSPFESGKYMDLSVVPKKNTKSSVTMINSSPLINVEVFLTAHGISLDQNTNYDSEEALKLIENYATVYLTNQISNYLYRTAKTFNSDICGFGRHAMTDYLTLDKWYDSNWLENYRNAFFNVTVNVTMKSGNIFARP